MFTEHKKVAYKKIKKAMIRTSRHVSEVLVNESPVWTGKYVEGMEIGPKAIMHARLSSPGQLPYPPKIDGTAIKASKKRELKIKAKVLINSGLKRIVFGNSAPHANFVERIGWEGKPPHHVFGKARESARLRK